MNILLITHEMNMGGASKSLVTLASELSNIGHNVVVILPFIKGQVYAELKKRKIKTYLLFFGWRVTSDDWNPIVQIGFKTLYAFENLYVNSVRMIIRKHNIDIVHSNSSVIDIGIRAAIKEDIPHVWHYREFQDFYHFEYIPSKNRRMQYINSSKGKVVYISHKLCEYYNCEVPFDIGEVIYNGVSKEFLIEKYKTKKNFSNEKVRFLLSGNFHRNKRHDVAIAAAEILYKKGYRNFELLIAGAIANIAESEKYEKELRNQAACIEDTVKFLGFVDDMVELRRNTDVELVCSRLEAFGRVTVEAMMASNPVIASDSGANPELIQEGQNGFLFCEGDASQLAEKMQILLDNTDMIGNLGAYAYRFAADNFLSSVNTNRIEELYKDLLK